MEKMNIIKLMFQEKEEQDKLQTNFEEEKHIKLLHNYYDEYLHYDLLNLAKNNVISYKINSKDDEENNNNKTIGIMKYFFLDNTIENIDKKKKLLNGIINMFLTYYPKIDFENDDFIEKLNYIVVKKLLKRK